MTRHCMRNGITLIEIVSTLALLLALAVTSAGMLSTVTKIGRSGGDARQLRRTVSDLADQFRSDVRSSEKVEISSEPAGIMVRGGEQTIRYAWDSDSSTLRRTESIEDEVTAVEQFVLSEQCDPQFSVTDERVSLSIKTGDHPWVMEAAR